MLIKKIQCNHSSIRISLLLAAIILSQTSFGQNVKVGATNAAPNAAAMLDVDGVTGVGAAYKGILIPRMTYAQRISLSVLAAVAQGLLAYQTDVSGTSQQGFYYNTSLTTTPNWVYLDGTTGWYITGNSNVTAANNFIGTTIAQDFVVKTNGSAATNERMRVLSGGNVIVNNTTIGSNTDDVFSVYASGTTNGTTSNISATGLDAVNGYSGTTGVGVYGENTGTGAGVFGENTGAALAANTSAYAVYGDNNRTPSGTGTTVGVMGWVESTVTSGEARGVQGTQYSTSGKGVIGFAQATTGTAVGVQGQSSASDGAGVAGFASTNATTGLPSGVFGEAASSTGFGVSGINTDASGTGIVGTGNNGGITALVVGSGGGFSGSTIGSFSYASSSTNSTGALNVSNGAPSTSLVAGCGVAGSSSITGVAGFAANWTFGTASSGGYFTSPGGALYVGAVNAAGTIRKIEGAGTVNTVVSDVNGKKVVLSAPEAPENLFMDFGKATLTNGTTHIYLDSTFALNIVVNDSHPLRVVLTPGGNCNQLYYTNTGNYGFDVTESNNGTSNTSFTWMVVANRADEVLPNGINSKYSSERFATAIPPQATTQMQTVSGTQKTSLVSEAGQPLDAAKKHPQH